MDSSRSSLHCGRQLGNSQHGGSHVSNASAIQEHSRRSWGGTLGGSTRYRARGGCDASSRRCWPIRSPGRSAGHRAPERLRLGRSAGTRQASGGQGCGRVRCPDFAAHRVPPRARARLDDVQRAHPSFRAAATRAGDHHPAPALAKRPVGGRHHSRPCSARHFRCDDPVAGRVYHVWKERCRRMRS